MITTRVEWSGDQAAEAVRSLTLERLTRATLKLWERVTEALNVPNTGERVKHPTKKTPSGRAVTYTIYPHPSLPGEPPRKRTGWLQRNTLYDIDEQAISGRVGVQQNAKYGAYLELGTRRMKARPFLLATVQKCIAELRAIIAGG